MFNDDEQRLANAAQKYLKENEDALIEKFASLKEYETDEVLISMFMAGTPGAGKTEVSKRLIEQFKKKPVRIDADEIRSFLPDYTGANAHVFQSAATLGVNKLYDHVLHKKLNVILDGTFAYSGAVNNIQRSLDLGRKVIIYYILQDIPTAWDFTKKREQLEKRRVSKEIFINAYLNSLQNLREVKEKFGEKVELNLIIKDFIQESEEIRPNIPSLDAQLSKIYTKDELERMLL